MLTATAFIAPVRGDLSSAVTVDVDSKNARRPMSVSFESYPANSMCPPTGMQRSSSCPEESVRSTRLASLYPRRLHICCDDDKLRMRLQQNAKLLLATAADANSSCNNSLLAKKALKHRNILARMADVDVNDPTFDVSKFLGVNWTKPQASA